MTTIEIPKISIIIPVYNVERYLRNCLDSALKQNYINFEIIAVNDGSTDNSLEVLNSYAKNDGRIRIINQKNKGLSGARNSGIRIAQGQYIIFLDSDDTIEKTLLSDVLKMAKDNTLDIVIFGYKKIDENGFVISKSAFKNLIFEKDLVRRSIIALKISPMACNKMYSRKLFIDNNIEYPEGMLHEDIGTTYKLIWCADRVGQSSVNYYNWFVRSDSITGNLKSKNISDIFHHFKEIRLFLNKIKLFKNYESEYLRGVFQMQNVLLERVRLSDESFFLYFFLKDIQNKFDLNTLDNFECFKNYDEKLHAKYFKLCKESELIFLNSKKSSNIKSIFSFFLKKLKSIK